MSDRPESTATAPLVAAVDLGGTRVRAAVVASDGTLLRRCERATDHSTGTPAQIPRLVRDVVADLPVERVVIGTPGRIGDAAVQYVRNLPQAWLPYLTEAWLSRATGLRVNLAGDAELAAVGEAYFGAGTRSADTAYLTFSTGVGAAALTRGRLIRTRRTGLLVGLVPHPTLTGDVLDAVASGQALRAYATRHGRADITARELAERADGGDREAALAWRQITDGAAWAAVLMCHLFCPDALVIGGGLATVGGPLLRPIEEAVARHGPQHLADPIRIAAARRGNDAALCGAAVWHLAADDTGPPVSRLPEET